jgi:hypothetical protein
MHRQSRTCNSVERKLAGQEIDLSRRLQLIHIDPQYLYDKGVSTYLRVEELDRHCPYPSPSPNI